MSKNKKLIKCEKCGEILNASLMSKEFIEKLSHCPFCYHKNTLVVIENPTEEQMKMVKYHDVAIPLSAANCGDTILGEPNSPKTIERRKTYNGKK